VKRTACASLSHAVEKRIRLRDRRPQQHPCFIRHPLRIELDLRRSVCGCREFRDSDDVASADRKLLRIERAAS
jgi:hypothetical protein